VDEEETPAERASGMNGNRRAASIDVPQNDVTPALPDGDEAVAVEDGKHLPPRQGREAWAHTATRTLVALTSW
jgi:hypothetical protein